MVAATVAVDLLVLGVFKYYGFFVQDVDRLLDTFGLGLPLPLLTIALPVGSRSSPSRRSPTSSTSAAGSASGRRTIDVAIYLSLLPASGGRADRARARVPAAARDAARSRDVAVGAGVVLIALGLVKKVAIADFLARSIVDPVFGVPEAYAAPDVLLAAYAYAAQIYCDFSGYTDIAIGLALLMGFVFPQNFDRPYRATSFREFWRRWHMTLSRYLRDYLYIPLGGNRGGRLATARNLMITMLLGGLWHGAAWTFVLWGALHGLLPGRRALPARPGLLAAAGLAALGDRLPRRRLRLDPLPRSRPRHGWAPSPSGSRTPAPATLLDAPASWSSCSA